MKELKKFYKDLNIGVLKVFDVKIQWTQKIHSVEHLKKISETWLKNIKKKLNEIDFNFIILSLILVSCGKKSEPKYQGSNIIL